MTWSWIQLQIQTHKLPHIGLMKNINIRFMLHKSQEYFSISKCYTEYALITNISCYDYRNMH